MLRQQYVPPLLHLLIPSILYISFIPSPTPNIKSLPQTHGEDERCNQSQSLNGRSKCTGIVIAHDSFPHSIQSRSNGHAILDRGGIGFVNILGVACAQLSRLLSKDIAEPPKEEVESGKHQMVIEVPHKGGLALTTTVQIPHIEMLGLRREVKAYIG